MFNQKKRKRNRRLKKIATAAAGAGAGAGVITGGLYLLSRGAKSSVPRLKATPAPTTLPTKNRQKESTLLNTKDKASSWQKDSKNTRNPFKRGIRNEVSLDDAPRISTTNSRKMSKKEQKHDRTKYRQEVLNPNSGQQLEGVETSPNRQKLTRGLKSLSAQLRNTKNPKKRKKIARKLKRTVDEAQRLGAYKANIPLSVFSKKHKLFR